MPRAIPASKAALGPYTPGYRNKWVSDPDWQNGLSRMAKALYTQIIEQPSINRAGVLQIDAQALADQHPGVTEGEIEQDLTELRSKNYVIQSGPWLFARSWFRYNRSTRNINHLQAILRDIETIGRKDLRDKVTCALFKSLAEGARDGEKFDPKVVSACSDFAKKWEADLPKEIAKAAKTKK